MGEVLAAGDNSLKILFGVCLGNSIDELISSDLLGDCAAHELLSLWVGEKHLVFFTHGGNGGNEGLGSDFILVDEDGDDGAFFVVGLKNYQFKVGAVPQGGVEGANSRSDKRAADLVFVFVEEHEF